MCFLAFLFYWCVSFNNCRAAQSNVRLQILTHVCIIHFNELQFVRKETRTASCLATPSLKRVLAQNIFISRKEKEPVISCASSFWLFTVSTCRKTWPFSFFLQYRYKMADIFSIFISFLCVWVRVPNKPQFLLISVFLPQRFVSCYLSVARYRPRPFSFPAPHSPNLSSLSSLSLFSGRPISQWHKSSRAEQKKKKVTAVLEILVSSRCF